MKKLVLGALCLGVVLAGCGGGAKPPGAGDVAAVPEKVLNVYNWSDYIAKDTIPNFEKQDGIHVKYDNYDSDDTLQAKLLTGNSGYDVVAPTSNYAGKQIAAPKGYGKGKYKAIEPAPGRYVKAKA